MANSDKNILITPNRNLSGQPEISFTGVANSSISMRIGDGANANLSFVSAGTTVTSIDSNLSSGTLYSVSDLSGIPVLEIPHSGDITIDANLLNINGQGVVLPEHKYDQIASKKEGLITFDPYNRSINVGTSKSFTNLNYGGKREIVSAGLSLHLDPASFYTQSGGTTATWQDYRGNPNFATAVNGPSYSSNFGGVVNLSRGSNQYFRIDDTIFWQDIRKVTYDLWFNTNASSSRQGLISTHGAIGASNNDAVEIEIQAAGNSFAGFRSTNGSFYQALTSPGISLNTWYHLSVVLDFYKIRYYLNGTLVATTTWPQTLVANSSSSALYLGRYEANYFGGMMGPFKIYTRDLTEREVRQNFEALRYRFGI